MRHVISSIPGTSRPSGASFIAGRRTRDSQAAPVFGFNRKARTAARRLVTGLLAVVALAAFGAAAASADSLYVGDGWDNTIKIFGANLATDNPFGGIFDTHANLLGPRGIVHLSTGNGNFLVANQAVNKSYAGEIDEFDSNGKFLGPLVSRMSPNPPFAPRGIVVNGNTLYVADTGQGDIGAVERYDATTGQFLGDVNFDSFINSPVSHGEFHPRGLVFGPDGRLYVSLFSENVQDNQWDYQHLGWIISTDLNGGVRVVASYSTTATDCQQYLHRPEGFTFGPDGNLYVVSRQPDLSRDDSDRVLVFTRTGGCRPSIDLDGPGQAHIYARSLVFGPGGKLYLPMTVCTTSDCAASPKPTAAPADAKAVRAYDLSAKPVTYTDFVNPVMDGSPHPALADWWYLTFGNTNPATLAYSG